MSLVKGMVRVYHSGGWGSPSPLTLLSLLSLFPTVLFSFYPSPPTIPDLSLRPRLSLALPDCSHAFLAHYPHSWDWGAITSTNIGVRAVGTPSQRTFSKGVWRDAWLSATLPGSATLLHAAPLVFNAGAYPVTPLTRESAGPWTVSVRALLRAPAGGARGALTVAGSWGGAGGASGLLSLPPGETLVVVNVTVAAGAVELWWPNGLGAQAMYNVTTTWTPVGTGKGVALTRRIGFRTVVIVTADDTDPTALAGVDGSGDLLVRWKVNGANMFLRGADVIPMENPEGRQSDVAYAGMLASAAAANMNVVRVDGIDLFFPDVSCFRVSQVTRTHSFLFLTKTCFRRVTL